MLQVEMYVTLRSFSKGVMVNSHDTCSLHGTSNANSLDPTKGLLSRAILKQITGRSQQSLKTRCQNGHEPWMNGVQTSLSPHTVRAAVCQGQRVLQGHSAQPCFEVSFALPPNLRKVTLHQVCRDISIIDKALCPAMSAYQISERGG